MTDAEKLEKLARELEIMRKDGNFWDSDAIIPDLRRIAQQLIAQEREIAEVKAQLYSACMECGSDDPELAANCPYRKMEQKLETKEREIRRLSAVLDEFNPQDVSEALERIKAAEER